LKYGKNRPENHGFSGQLYRAGKDMYASKFGLQLPIFSTQADGITAPFLNNSCLFKPG
jgi:hypothetical protein